MHGRTEQLHRNFTREALKEMVGTVGFDWLEEVMMLVMGQRPHGDWKANEMKRCRRSEDARCIIRRSCRVTMTYVAVAIGGRCTAVSIHKCV